MDKMVFLSITGIINFSGTILLAVFVYSKNPKSNINLTCGLFNLSIALWSFGYIFWPLSCAKEFTLFWFQVLHCGALFISITLVHFVLALLNIPRPKTLAIGYSLCFILLPFIFTPLFISDIRPIGSLPFWGVAGQLYYFFLMIFFGYATYAIILLFKSFHTATLYTKNQLKYIIVGIIAGYIGGSTNFLPFFGIAMLPYLNILVTIYATMFVYAIVAHKLLDITVIFRKTLVYSILATMIAVVYFGIIITLENLFRECFGYKSFVLSFLIISLFIVLFQPLKNYIQNFLDRLFFHGTIDQIDAENLQLRSELEKSERLKSVATLAAGMAHEIKNPLTSIKTFTEYLDRKKNDPEFIKKFQTIVGDEVERINRIVKQLLEFAKPADLKLKNTDLNQIIDDTINLLNNELLRREIQVKKHYSLLPQVMADPMQMRQVVLNILLNAIESIDRTGTISVYTLDDQDGTVSAIIADTGKGMDPEDLKHIFDPFFSKKDGGTGLGLSVVHGIIKRHGGAITAESSPGNGATFTITLPLNNKKE